MMCEGNKTQFLSSKSYPSKGTGLTQLKQLRAQDSGSWNLKEKGSHAEVPENTRFLPQGEKKVKKKKKKILWTLTLLLSEVTFPFYLWLLGSSEPNLPAASNNFTILCNMQYCILTLPLISSYFPVLFSFSLNFLVCLLSCFYSLYLRVTSYSFF